MKELGQPNTEFHVSWILSSCSQAPHSFSFASTAKQIVDNIEYCISLLYDLSIFITKNLLTEPSPSSLNTNRRYQVHLALLKFEECECAQLWWKILACPQTQRPRIFGANLLREKIRRLRYNYKSFCSWACSDSYRSVTIFSLHRKTFPGGVAKIFYSIRVFWTEDQSTRFSARLPPDPNQPLPPWGPFFFNLVIMSSPSFSLHSSTLAAALSTSISMKFRISSQHQQSASALASSIQHQHSASAFSINFLPRFSISTQHQFQGSLLCASWHTNWCFSTLQNFWKISPFVLFAAKPTAIFPARLTISRHAWTRVGNAHHRYQSVPWCTVSA